MRTTGFSRTKRASAAAATASAAAAIRRLLPDRVLASLIRGGTDIGDFSSESSLLRFAVPDTSGGATTRGGLGAFSTAAITRARRAETSAREGATAASSRAAAPPPARAAARASASDAAAEITRGGEVTGDFADAVRKVESARALSIEKDSICVVRDGGRKATPCTVDCDCACFGAGR